MPTAGEDDQLTGTPLVPSEDTTSTLAEPGLPRMNDSYRPPGRDGHGLSSDPIEPSIPSDASLHLRPGHSLSSDPVEPETRSNAPQTDSDRVSALGTQDTKSLEHEIVDSETPSAQKTRVESHDGRSRSSSPASSVTSPTSTENNDMANERAAAAKEQPEPSTQATSAPPLPSEPIPGTQAGSAPPLPSEPLPGAEATAAPLPSEPTPAQEDDGWEYHWNASTNSYWFYNRFTQVWSSENPRLAPAITSYAPGVPQATVPPPTVVAGQVISDPTSLSGGYNPAIHGDYDPNAWYAQAARSVEEQTAEQQAAALDPEYATAGFFNRNTGQWQHPEQGPERHSDEAKSKRQLNNFFDVDAAANEHDGRSLRAERAGKKPTKAELKAYKEKRRARKEEKRRAWLRD